MKQATLPSALLAAGLCLMPLAAQAVPGGPLPELPALTWLQGGPVVLTGESAPRLTLLGCYRGLEALRNDNDHLAGLRRRLRETPLQVVALLAEAPAAEQLAALKPALPVGRDDDGSARRILFGDEVQDRLCLFDRDGRVLWRGRPELGASLALERALADGFDPTDAVTAASVRENLLGGFDDVFGKDAAEQIGWLLKHNRRDGVAWALKYMLNVEKSADEAAARRTLAEACKELATEPAALRAFADLALRSDPGNEFLGRELVQALTPASAMAPNDVWIQLALLRALVRAGADREVGRVARMLARRAGQDAASALLLAEILADDKTPEVHADTAQKALESAARLEADPRQLMAARYKVKLRCEADKAGARKLAEQYMEQHAARVTLNNDAWYLMTQPETKGRFDAMALALCERMLEQKEAMDYFEYDTVALCMFLNGRVQEAVELQKTAIERGGNDSPAYRERLHRFEAALERKGAGAGKGGAR